MSECAKYTLTDCTKTVNQTTLHRVQSLKRFRTIDGCIVEEGQTGGFISDTSVLSQNGVSWVSDEALVIGGKITGDALIQEDARLFNTRASERVIINGHAMCNNVNASCNAIITGNTYVDKAIVTGGAFIDDNAHVVGSEGYSYLAGGTYVGDSSRIDSSHLLDACILGDSIVNNSYVSGYDICKYSHLNSVTLMGKMGHTSNSILKNITVYTPCKFNDAQVTKQDEFWFMIAHSKGLSYVALYPNRDGKVVVVYHSSGYPEVVSPDKFDNIVKRNGYMPLKRWRAIKDIALASIKESRKE